MFLALYKYYRTRKVLPHLLTTHTYKCNLYDYLYLHTFGGRDTVLGGRDSAGPGIY